MSELLEVCMVVCFGISWPTSIVKSYRSRTAVGKSPVFLTFIWLGYVFGIFSKLLSGNITYVVAFYVLNLVAVSIDFALYFRNLGLDRQRKAQ